MNMSRPFRETLAMIVEVLTVATDPWWVIGSAAVVLHGRHIRHVRDVDLLMSPTDADALLRHVGELPRQGVPNDRFRSQVFGTWRGPPLPVEVMGGLEVANATGWRAVSLSSAQRVTVDGNILYVPSVEELVGLLHLFGRKKDLERAALLQS